MSDTITLPSGLEVYEGKVLVLPGASTIMPTGDLTPTEVQALRSDIADIQGMGLGDLSNVAETGKADGLVLTVQPDGNWAPESPPIGISRVWDFGNELPGAPFDALQANAPLRASVHPTTGGFARLSIDMGKTSTTVAAGNHTHPPTLKGRLVFDKNASVLGAGATDLVNESISGLIPGVVYDVDILGDLEAVNTNTSGRLTLYMRIGSTGTIQSVSRGFSGGVWTSVSAHGTRMNVTNATSLPLRFWVEYESGDPTALYSGYLAYTISPRGGQS